MKFADASAISYRTPGTRHREGNIEFKYLLTGEAGSPRNYELSIVRTQDHFESPAHRHNFDQIRYVLSGAFGEKGPLELKPGEVGYYPEGTPYRISSGNSEVLLLQFGGASGAGFTHYDELRAAYPQLAQKGEFANGIFRWHEPPPGAARQQDGYEALWELINGKKLVYPKQRYRQPVVMTPAGFEWLPLHEGIEQRALGSFTERNIGVRQVRVRAGGSRSLPAAGQVRLFYVLEGSGRIGAQDVHPGCALELPAGNACPMLANDALLLLVMELPDFR